MRSFRSRRVAARNARAHALAQRMAQSVKDDARCVDGIGARIVTASRVAGCGWHNAQDIACES